MKRKLLFCLSFAALLTVGCTQDINEVELTPSLGVTPQIRIEGSINQEYVSRVDDNGFCTGDQIGLFGVNYTDNNATAGDLLDSGNQVDNARYTYDRENNAWTSSQAVYYKDAETNIDLYGYYPYSAVESVNSYLFEVQQDQSGANSMDGYSLSDFLWGKTSNVTPTEEKITIRYNHMLSCLAVTLKEGEGFAEGEFATLKQSVLVTNTTRQATIDLATGAVTSTGDAASEGIVMKSGDSGYRAIVVPQVVAAGKSLLAITLDGITYRYKYQKGAADFIFEQGKQTNITLTVKRSAHSGSYEFELTDCAIVDWVADLDSNGGEARQYYVVHCEEPGTLEQKLAEAKKDPAKIKNLKISGKICGVDFQFMRNSMTSLQAVNLKESEIAPAWSAHILPQGDSYYRYVYFVGVAPENSNERTAIIKEAYPNCSISTFTQYNAHEIPDWAFSGKSTLTYFSFPEKVTKIGGYAFRDCSLLSGALIIPDGVTEIGAEAFDGCSNLTSLSLPIGLEKIDNYAFSECENLSGTLSIPATVTYIGDHTFEYCSGFTGQLVLPENLTYLGGRAFRDCIGFTGDLKIPEGVKTLYDGSFSYCLGFNGQLTLHDNLTFEQTNSYVTGQFYECNFQGELKLPAKLKSIPEGCFEGNNFSTIAGFPDGLLEIGDRAFYGCWRLMGTLEFPESLVSLGERAFGGCSTLEGIVLPSELGLLKAEAFRDCYGLNNIVCKSLEPPTIFDSTFSGVAKDNFAVEVPEQSINRYQSDAKWGEFKRIVAHHDFTISRRLMRTLNAEHSRKLILRAPAEHAWSIESQPEWVTVTPSNGVGKVEVTVTVNEMAAAEAGTFEINVGAYNSPKYETHKGRAGEVVFLLNDKDYRATLKVEQYDYEYGDGDVLVHQTATEGNGVNIVFMGDCFDARDVADGSYLKGIEEAIGYYFAIEPYKTYKEYFNIYTVFGVSKDSGMGTVNTVKEAKFGSQYALEHIAPDTQITYEYAMKAETVNEDNLNKSLVVLVENTTDYGGICYMWGDGSAIAICPMSRDAYPYDFRGIVQHEAGGHGFGKLADEYIYHNAFIQSCTCTCCDHLSEFRASKNLGWYRNLSEVGDMKSVEWAHLIYHPDYSNIVDMYEGGFFHTRGIYRSESTSCMNNNIPYYSAISRQEMVERIMKYAGKEFSLEEFYAKDVRDASNNTRSATRLEVEENALTLKGASKQLPPKFMGDKPQLKKSNK